MTDGIANISILYLKLDFMLKINYEFFFSVFHILPNVSGKTISGVIFAECETHHFGIPNILVIFLGVICLNCLLRMIIKTE